MQNSTQSNPDPDPLTVATALNPLDKDAEAPPGVNEPDTNTANTIQADMGTVLMGNGSDRESADCNKCESSLEERPSAQQHTQPLDQAGGLELDAVSKPNLPGGPETDLSASTGCGSQEDKNRVKPVSDGRKYVPSKKAMIDPLKMDMSKPRLTPLTSSQMSLQCIECHIIFRDHKSKVRHLKLSHPAEYEQCMLKNSFFTCYVCDRHFTNSTELMAHQKSHNDRKPFRCPLCKQAFKKSSELTVHKKVHVGSGGYACTDCGKSCKTMTLLKYHLRTHTGETPFVCLECGKRFTRPKLLHTHMLLHSSLDAEGNESNAKVPGTKEDGAPPKYPCTICKAAFKTPKTRLRHIKTKHKVLLANGNTLTPGQQGKHNTPIITPLSFGQAGLLQVVPDGPLQKVDANVDTEQICRLIESLGNVQKVNQVVILGQVPPDAQPLEVHQIPQGADPLHSNLNPLQLHFMGLKPTQSEELNFSSNQYDPMEQTIILEPITPDGQPEPNPLFQGICSEVTISENIQVTLGQCGQTETSSGELTHQGLEQTDGDVGQCYTVDQIVCQNEGDAQQPNLEETFILELTPALAPTMELGQSQTVAQNEILHLSSKETTDIENISDQASSQETSLNIEPSRLETKLDLEPTQEEHHVPVIPHKTLQNTAETEAIACEGVDLASQEVNGDHIDNPDSGTLQGTNDQKSNASEILQEMDVEGTKEVKDSCETVDNSTESKDQAVSKQETKQTPQVSELPVSVMSAQELVKVRKRKPARAFFLQGYMQDFVGSIHKDDLHVGPQPVKRKRTKKPHLVVKFGPQEKAKKSKEKTPSPKCKKKTEDSINGKSKILEMKKGRKGKPGKKAEIRAPLVDETPSTPETPDVLMQPAKEGARKIKKNKQRKSEKKLAPVRERKVASSPGFKKKKQAKIMRKGTIKNASGEKEKKKQLEKEIERQTLPNIPGQTLPQDALLLLRGHKQPQLKVYKLDTSKPSGQTPASSPGSQQNSDKNLSNATSGTIISGTAQSKKKGRPKKNSKAFSILSSLKVANKAPEVVPAKPGTPRKRKASTKVEAEGVITSKRALECNNCGETFNEVSSLQKHKTTVHVVKSPGLTYTNGNVFEGVSRLDLYQLPKGRPEVGGLRNAAAPDWDTEPETGDTMAEDREPSLSFPALIPSPSLPVPFCENGINIFEDNGASVKDVNDHFQTSVDVHSASKQVQHNKTNNVQNRERRETVAPDPSEPTKRINSENQVGNSPEEDVKENLLLQVDLVTVGDQPDRDELAPIEDAEAQILSQETCHSGTQSSWQERHETGVHLQTVSCSTREIAVKEEEEEMAIQKKKRGSLPSVARNARFKKGRGKRRMCALSKKSLAADGPLESCSDNAQPECQVVYERYALSSDSESQDQREAASIHSKPEVALESEASKLSSLKDSPKKQGDAQSTLATKGLQEEIKDREPQGLRTQDGGQSPVIILEKILPSRYQMSDMTKQSNRRQVWEAHTNSEGQSSRNQDIKVEEHTSDLAATAASCENQLSAVVQPQHHRELRTVFVKEESPILFNEVSGPVNKHIQWNMESVTSAGATSPLTDNVERTKDCGLTPELSTSQCIFYPVKEEENEVLCSPQSSCDVNLSSAVFHNDVQTNLQDIDIHSDEGSNSTRSYRGSKRGGNNEEAEAETYTAREQPPDLQDFLLQSSDEEDVCSMELSDAQLDLEVEIMAHFDKSPRNNTRLLCKNLPNVSHPQTSREEDGTNEPIKNFSKYLDWETWVEIANCTNARCKSSNPISAREVAQFVGIHIAMGTLKFPSPTLYWKDLTKVPLIAEAMPLSRFLELARLLKFAPPANHPAQEDTRGSDCNSLEPDEDVSCTSSRRHKERLKTCCIPTTNPLRKVEPLLQRFKAGCQSMRRDNDCAVDQYPLPLTLKMHNKNPALRCTTVIGVGGFLQHLDLKLGLPDEEDAVEQMVPGGSMVYLCKQELSTPAMLERLLTAGVHGAGRVGGARGQIGDEFVSSDGKLMLRRSHGGFILSTAGNGQRDMSSLIDNFDKAQMSAQVNKDLQNLYPTPLTASAPTCWPQAVLWFLTDLSLINSWLLYRRNRSADAAPLTLMAFRLEVSKALIRSSGPDTQDAVPPQPPTENVRPTNDASNPTLVDHSPLPDAATRYDGFGHWPEQLGEGEGGMCRFRDCRRTSRVLCLKCCVFLCISRNNNCFWNFHNQKSMVK